MSFKCRSKKCFCNFTFFNLININYIFLFQITIIVNIKRNFAYKYFLINRTENVCELTSGKNKSTPLLNILIEPFKKYSNLIHPCPYNIGNLTIADFPVDCIKFPEFIPAGEYRVDFRLFNKKNETIYLYRAFLTIEAKGIDQLLVGQNMID